MTGKNREKRNLRVVVLLTTVTALLLCMVFFTVINYFYKRTMENAYENFHLQTKQIKDDIVLQLNSDRENLATMANFAAKLYSDGESYDIMFDSFQPIGLIGNIGILNPDNTFTIKGASIDLNGKISFEEELARQETVSGRMQDLTRDNYEIIRSAVPIQVDGETVGILYGVIKLNAIGEKYGNMAEELDAQLFVYHKETGMLLIDTIHDQLGNISFLKDRTYNDGYSYETFRNTDKGFISFVSAYTGENMYAHYSDIEAFGWTIVLARYESQVFQETHDISGMLTVAFSFSVAVMVLYTIFLIMRERSRSAILSKAADIRRILLETSRQENGMVQALKQVCIFVKARSALLVGNDGEEFDYSTSEDNQILQAADRKRFISELYRYASEKYKNNPSSLVGIRILVNKHLQKTNPDFYIFLRAYDIFEVAFLAVTDQNKYTTILAVQNPKNSRFARNLGERIAACFSIALANSKHLKKTELAATTDALTGVMNRLAYKRDLKQMDVEKPRNFSCIYIDVNELHLRNNKYGHEDGDAMLIYIANTLKELFYNQSIYRIGGDEFLLFVQDASLETVKKNLSLFVDLIKLMNYHVAFGISYRSQNTNTDEMVREAEMKMYEDKALYYQKKEQNNTIADREKGYNRIHTNIAAVDTMLLVLQEHYESIFQVCLNTDRAIGILIPAYLKFDEKKDRFSALFSNFVIESVNGDFQRAALSFINYEALRDQLEKGNIPRITYIVEDGSTESLSIYKLEDEDKASYNTLWVFSKK